MRVDKLIVVADSLETSDEEVKDKSATLKHKLEEPILDDLVKGIQELKLNFKTLKLEGLRVLHQIQGHNLQEGVVVVISKADDDDAKSYGDLWTYGLKMAKRADEAWVKEKQKWDEETAGSSKRATKFSNKKEEVPKPMLEVSMEDAPKDKKQGDIGCVDPNVVTPMVIFIVPYMPWSLRPIPIPKAHLPKLLNLLNEKMRMGSLEPSCAPYSNRWFTIPKKNGTLRFIQDMQPINKVTICNVGTSPNVDEFAKAFVGRAIYSMSDLYSRYDQLQLALESKDLTTMCTPLGLVRMCTLQHGATNLVAHMMNGMNKELRDFIPHITMPFIDDFPIKGCEEESKEEVKDQRAFQQFVTLHIADCDAILSRLEEVNLTLSGHKSTFGAKEILIVRHMCGPDGR
ncbi:hypothetical protein L7F22_030226 [Adiantum nelumboides]|nr:hypothetical protein [Adiantum nelumboides]